MKSPEEAATELLTQFRVGAPPVPVQDIAEGLGVRLHYRPFEGDVSGMLFRHGESRVLGVNSSHGHKRQRFTIAHELGHLSLHKGREMFVNRLVRVNLRNTTSSLGSDIEEIQANQFAAQLLMPREAVIAESEKRYRRLSSKREEDMTRELADLFDVSLSAMEFRLVNLGVINPV